ncbi:hypothetical protein CIK05_04680 [Bdellovibrio sp. qaytius]|nr:hypothetical protein CIK05_04680 [Bdellovibrio sp. qaytius]
MNQTIKTTLSICLLALYTITAGCTAKPVAEREPSSTYGRAKLNEAYFFDKATINAREVKLRKFDLNNQADINQIEQDAKAFLAEYKKRKDSDFPETEQYVVGLEAKEPFNKFDFTTGGLKDAAEYIVEVYNRWRRGEIKVDEAQYQIAQVSRAVVLNYIEPVKNHYEFFKFPVYLSRFLSTPSVSENYKGQDPDLKYVRDEVYQEKDISKIDFHQDYRFKDVNVTDGCKYLKAKRGFGVHAGFQITCGKTDYKIKFGNERYSGPFNTRIYRALGLVAPHLNYFDNVVVNYDRKVITEFNSRAPTNIKITVVAVPVTTRAIQEYENPFDFISGLRMKDGSFVDGKTAQARLFKRPFDKTFTEDVIDTNFESQISQFVFGPSTLTLKDDPAMGDELGPWVPDDFNYSDFKEIRGLIVLAAWTGNFDVRKDNLRLLAVKDSKGQKRLRIAFGDAGSGLGHATGAARSGSTIEDMKWEVSTVYQDNNNNDRSSHDSEERISLSGIAELEYAKAFSRIKLSDAQWMTRKLCQISPDQIKAALVSSGLSSAEVVLAQAKLLERRNKMMEHFKMDEDFVASCYVKVDRKLNYDPMKNSLVTISYDNKSKATAAPDRGQYVKDGHLLPASKVKQDFN